MSDIFWYLATTVVAFGAGWYGRKIWHEHRRKPIKFVKGPVPTWDY